MTIPVFKRQNQLSRIIPIHQRGPSHTPWPGGFQAIITKLLGSPVFSGQWDTTKGTAQAGHKRCFSPTRATQAKITIHLRSAQRAARRIDQVQSRLNCPYRHPIVATMSTPLTDRNALIRNRRRALLDPVMFLHEAAVDEFKDRLELIKKSFTSIAVVSGYPDWWRMAFPDALHVSDDEILTLEEGSCDLVLHAMCLHWANDPVGQMIQVRRALRPDGAFLGIFPGGQTLNELRISLAQAESDIRGGLSPRIVPMGEIRELGALLQRAGFALPVADSVPLKTSYASPLHLMRELRFMGEANVLSRRARHFCRRDLLIRACEIYASEFKDGADRIRATFDLIVLTGWSPDESQPKPLRPGSASSRLADVLGTTENPLKD